MTVEQQQETKFVGATVYKRRDKMADLSGSVQYREMVDITSKAKGLRKPRKLKLVRNIPTFQEVDLQARGGVGRASGVTEVVNMTSTRLMATSREVTKLRGSTEGDQVRCLYVFGTGSSNL